MAELTPTAPVAVSPAALPAAALIATAFRAVATRWPQALAFWAAGAAWGLGERQLRAWEGLEPVRLSPMWFGIMVLSAAVAAVLATLMLQLFLERGEAWWRPDRRTWACAGLLTAASVASSVAIFASLSRVGVGQLGEAMARQALTLATQVLLWWIFARLMLWPIGVLMGDADMTPARSWRLMSGQVAGFLGAVILINLPLVVGVAAYQLIAGFGHRLAAAGVVRPTVLVTSLVTPALVVLQQAMAAAVYRAKTTSARAATESTRR